MIRGNRRLSWLYHFRLRQLVELNHNEPSIDRAYTGFQSRGKCWKSINQSPTVASLAIFISARAPRRTEVFDPLSAKN